MDGFLILSIETATGCGSVAVTRGGVRQGRIVGEVLLKPESVHSRRLLGGIDFLLDGLNLGWSDLDGIGISLGPGSFTGLRIGLAAAKGLVMASGLPLLGVMTMDGLALSCLTTPKKVCCLLDARKNEVYCGFYVVGSGIPARQGPFQALRPAALVRQINEPTLVAGPGIAACDDLLAGHPDVELLPHSLGQPRATHIGLLAADLLHRGERMDPVTAVPFYLRASEAEVNAVRKRGKETIS